MSLRSGLICVVTLIVGCSQEDSGAAGNELEGSKFPCDIADILNRKCLQCHGPQPVAAPMALVSPEVLYTTSQTLAGAGKQVGQLFLDRINSPNSPMPPRNGAVNGPLTDAERNVLNAWLGKGGPPGGPEAAACQPFVPPAGAGGLQNGTGGAQYGAGGMVPPPGAGGTWSAGGAPPGSGGTFVGSGGTSSGGAGAGGEAVESDTPREPLPGECNVVPIRARAGVSVPPGVTTGAPYQVPSNYIDKYICFDFDLGLPGPSHALQFKARVPDPSYVHHWLLYKKKDGVGAYGGLNSECLGLHSDAELIAGWAPGTGDWNLPGHVGMDMGEGKFILEIHYNNTGGPRQDESGVDVCVTQNLRRETAGLHWLGTEDISIPAQQAKDEASMCRPANQTQPIHVLRWWPHMHLLGRNMKIDLYRNGAFAETVLDEPFDFFNQIQYDRPRIINPGDGILTTCSFFNTTGSTVPFGTGTAQEMCYNFVVAYPQNSLVSQPRGLHENSCQGRP